MSNPNTTNEARQEKRREYLREYMRQYRAKYPDREKQYRREWAKNLLQRDGYTVSRVEGGAEE